MSITVEITDYSKDLIKKNNVAMKEAFQDILLDISNTAKGSAPHWKGRLEKGITHTLINSKAYFEGTVGVSVSEKGFDYGIYRHDHPFKLGEKSKKKSGGKSGISGKSFEVGHGFISRPMDEGKEAYLGYIDQKFQQAINSRG